MMVKSYSLYMHRQPSPPYDYDIEDCKAILLYEAEKLYISLAKRMVDEVIDEHASKTSASLPMLPLADKQPQQNSSLSKGLTVLYISLYIVYRGLVKVGMS